MPASVTGEKGDGLAFEIADQVCVRGIAEGCVEPDLFLRMKTGHGIQTAAADNADLCCLFQLFDIFLHLPLPYGRGSDFFIPLPYGRGPDLFLDQFQENAAS